MGASASTPEAEPDAPSYWPSLTVRTSCSPPEPSTPVAPPTTPHDGPPRRSWGWSEVFGALVEQRVIEAIPTHKVDSMQGMWQRALRAKTAAIDKLRDELDSAYARVHELEMERDARDAAEKFADTRPLERETERSHLEAQSTAMSILRELRLDVEEREKKLVALTDALRRASMNAAERERAVCAARAETKIRGERFREAESFLNARLTEVTNELKRTRDACEILTKDAREGEAVLSELIERFQLVAFETTSRRDIEIKNATRLARDMASLVYVAERDARDATEARETTRRAFLSDVTEHDAEDDDERSCHTTGARSRSVACVEKEGAFSAVDEDAAASTRGAKTKFSFSAHERKKDSRNTRETTPRAVLSLAKLAVLEPRGSGAFSSRPSSPPSPPSPEMAERARRAKADAALRAGDAIE